LRQRAFDAWLCAYRLRKIIDVWRSWFHQLKREGDADPGAAYRLWETAITCAQALWACGARIPTLRRDGPEGIAASLPDYPCGADGEWQNDPRLIASQARLADLFDFQGELSAFMTLLANSPSTAFDTPPAGPGRQQGEEGFASRTSDQRGARGAGGGKSPAEDATPPPPPPSVKWCFAPSGDGYFVAGFGESGHLSGYKGLSDIARLIKTPGEPVPMLDLEGAGQQLKRDRRSRQPAVDAPGLQQIAGQLKELKADLERALAEKNTVEADAARSQIEQLEASRASAMGVGGKMRDLNDLYNRLRPKIHGRLQTVYNAMREADPPMKQLADHFELSISCEGGSGFVYRPVGTPPPWRFERTEQK
jgi:hypothetical protein